MANASKLTLALINKRPLAAARVLATLSVPDAAEFAAAIPVRYAVKILEPLNPMLCAEIVQALPEDSVQAVLRDMEFVHAAAVLRRIDIDRRDSILSALPVDRREEFEAVLQFAPESVGAHMKTSVVVATKDETVTTVLSRLRADKDGICDAIFVVDSQQKLLGSVPIASLVRQRGVVTMDDVMNDLCPPISGRSRLSQIAAHPAWAQNSQLPVVSRRGELLGVLYRRTAFAELTGDDASARASAPSVVTSLLNLMWGSATGLSALVASEPEKRGRSTQ